MPHKRSPRALGRRFAARLSYHDKTRAEDVCTVTTSQVLDHLVTVFPGDGVSPADAAFERGEILIDSRGTGSLQHPDVLSNNQSTTQPQKKTL